MRVNHPHTRPVLQYTLDKVNLIAKYDSIRQAAKLTGISRNLCIKQGKLSKNYIKGDCVALYQVLLRFFSTINEEFPMNPLNSVSAPSPA